MKTSSSSQSGACCANVNYIWFCKWNLIRDDFSSLFLLLKARNKRKSFCPCISKSIPLNLCSATGQGNVPPGFGWEDLPGAGKSQRACQHALWLPWYFRGLFIMLHHQQNTCTPVNSNLPIWCCVVWDVRFWCQMKTAFLCLTHQRSFHLYNFLIPSLFFYCAVFGAAGRVLEPLPAAPMWRQGTTLDEAPARLIDYKCLRTHSFRTRVASQTFPQRSPVEAERPVTSVGLQGTVFFIVFELHGHWLNPTVVSRPRTLGLRMMIGGSVQRLNPFLIDRELWPMHRQRGNFHCWGWTSFPANTILQGFISKKNSTSVTFGHF